MEEVKENIENVAPKSWEDKMKDFLRFDEKNLLNNLPLLLFIAILGVLHVANNHTAENKIREISKVEQELKELRWMYMTSKADLMFKSKQSEVAKMVEGMGLQPLVAPPYKIVVKEDDYE